MAYKIYITGKEKSDNKVKVAFEVREGKKVVIKHEVKVSDENELKSKVREFVADLENSRNLANTPVGELDISDPESIPQTPTQEQVDKDAFHDKLGELKKKSMYADLGLIQQGDLDTLRSEVISLGNKIKEF